MRTVIRDDAVYRVRFAHSVAVIEEDEEVTGQLELEMPDIESAQYLQNLVVDSPLYMTRTPMYD